MSAKKKVVFQFDERSLVRPGEEVEAASSLAAPHCSLSGFGSEILIAQWEARAAQCDQTAEQLRTSMQGHVCSYLEKARAYRLCIEELRRQMEHENKRQPTENAPHEQRGAKT